MTFECDCDGPCDGHEMTPEDKEEFRATATAMFKEAADAPKGRLKMIERTDKNLKRIVILNLDGSRDVTENVLSAGYLDIGMGAIAIQQKDAQVIIPFSDIKGCRLEYEDG